MGQAGFCENLWFPCGFLRNLGFPAVFCENPKYCNSQGKAKVCKHLRKSAKKLRISLCLSLLVCPFYFLLIKDAALEDCDCAVLLSCLIFRSALGTKPVTPPHHSVWLISSTFLLQDISFISCLAMTFSMDNASDKRSNCTAAADGKALHNLEMLWHSNMMVCFGIGLF